MYSSEYTSGFSGPVASHLVAPLSPRHEGTVGQAPIYRSSYDGPRAELVALAEVLDTNGDVGHDLKSG